MITRGQITEILSPTKVKVRLDLFSTPEMPVKPIDCEVCYSPGVYNAYRVGDFVYVGFIENQIGQPLILGRLYSNEAGNESPQQPRGFMNPQGFAPGTSIDLPLSTKIGSISGYEIEKAVSNSLLKKGRSIDLQGSGSNTPATAVCAKLDTNLYGVDTSTIGLKVAEESSNLLVTTLSGDPKLTPKQIQDYTYFMTGVRFMPPATTDGVHPENPGRFDGALIIKEEMSVWFLLTRQVDDNLYHLYIVKA